MQPETGPLPFEAQRLHGAQPMASTAVPNTPRSFAGAAAAATEQPDTPGTPSGGAKARVFVSGPGGADTKQGAKIACLECRSAKIKCSAPTDGNVPCKRCVKHAKECLFEKHKRGRKPNKRFSVLGSSHSGEGGGGSQDGDHYDASDAPPHHARARSSEALGDAAANAPGVARPVSAGQSQHAHPNSRDSHFGAQGDVEQRFRSWSNVDAPNRGAAAADPAMQPWHYPTSSSSHHHPSHLQHHHQRPAEDRVMHGADGRGPYHPANGSSRPTYAPGPVPAQGMSASASAPSGLHQLGGGGGGGDAAGQYTHHGHQALSATSSSGSHGRPPTDYGNGAGGGRWKEPAGRSSHASSPSSGGAKALGSPSRVDSTASAPYSHSRNRSYGHSGPAPSHSYQHWDSQLGLERGSRGRADAARSPNGGPAEGAYQREGGPHEGDYQAADGRARTNGMGGRSTTDATASSDDHRGERQGSHGAPSGRRRDDRRSAAPASYADDADIELDDEQDELEDDADATREEHDNVLSNPLKLLAQASDAAAARIEGGRLESGGRHSLAAAETMGLLGGASTASRMAMSAAVNLTGLGRPMYGRGDMMPPQGWSSSRILPPLFHQDRGSSSSLRDTFHPERGGSRLPTFLGSLSRSKSYPSAESLQASSEASGPAAHDDAEARPMQQESNASPAREGAAAGGATIPSTLDHDAWEYREGKAQTRRGYAPSSGAAASPGTLSHGGQTVSSATSAGFPASVHARQGDSPLPSTGAGDGAASDDARATLTGKRKRARSRLARGGSRRRRLNDRDSDGEGDPDASHDEDPTVEPRGRDKQVSIAAAPDDRRPDGVGSGSGGEGEAGASRKGYFNLSLFHSKNDDDEGLDPVELGLVELKEVERLFDLFFARINPILDLFDPFLHSVSFVRMRSAFLTTVIACMAARFSDTVRDAKIASLLDRHWQNKLLPTILLGGYKSVEISQAFLILTTYSRPTSRLVDDRSWQYLGFAIRTATEVGVNRKVTPSESLLGNEQVSRRLRNRERLWFNLFLYDRTLSAQTGRPWTISEDRMIVQSSMWHKQDFALPEDVSLVSLIRLRRIAAQHSEAFDNYLGSQDQLDAAQTTAATAAALNAGEQSHLERRLAGLEFFRKHANADLEKWKQSWCINTEEKIRAVDTSTAAGKYLVRWAPTAKLFYYHSRLIINSLVLGTTEQHEGLVPGSSSASVECWTSAISLIDTVLNDFDDDSLVAWSNDRVVMAVYAAVSALRLTNLAAQYPFADKETAVALVRRLSAAMTKAGKTPRHRNGSATPYGRYLKSVLAIFEPDPGPSRTGDAQRARGQTPPDKDSENATSLTSSSLAPGDSGSQQGIAASAAVADDKSAAAPTAVGVKTSDAVAPQARKSEASPAAAATAASAAPGDVLVPDLGTLDASLDGNLALLDSASSSKLSSDLPLDAWTAGRDAAVQPSADPAATAALSALGPSADPADPVAMTIATAAAAAGGSFAASGAGTSAAAVDDPESIDRLWDCLTSFEPQGFSGAFWQPPSTWNVSGGGGGGGTGGSAGGGVG
ncbi:uncharacterized protein PFL1_01536 [Pseudozyma flocculosa PF-1]|uniref:uncharacterized protein n=1 Tax=Pseudozyma flocculosa PF-1 TaxID=1277687 RepID=UPI0004560CB2|nr:uncharacterized protein PFL1_01536 [Pseudozyma flocculosa PF-1]EPQ30635.1 hypothetical protein PFL1_01536 [Pseudozyma flocculosa PF-1]